MSKSRSCSPAECPIATKTLQPNQTTATQIELTVSSQTPPPRPPTAKNECTSPCKQKLPSAKIAVSIPSGTSRKSSLTHEKVPPQGLRKGCKAPRNKCGAIDRSGRVIESPHSEEPKSVKSEKVYKYTKDIKSEVSTGKHVKSPTDSKLVSAPSIPPSESEDGKLELHGKEERTLAVINETKSAATNTKEDSLEDGSVKTLDTTKTQINDQLEKTVSTEQATIPDYTNLKPDPSHDHKDSNLERTDDIPELKTDITDLPSQPTHTVEHPAQIHLVTKDTQSKPIDINTVATEATYKIHTASLSHDKKECKSPCKQKSTKSQIGSGRKSCPARGKISQPGVKKVCKSTEPKCDTTEVRPVCACTVIKIPHEAEPRAIIPSTPEATEIEEHVDVISPKISDVKHIETVDVKVSIAKDVKLDSDITEVDTVEAKDVILTESVVKDSEPVATEYTELKESVVIEHADEESLTLAEPDIKDNKHVEEKDIDLKGSDIKDIEHVEEKGEDLKESDIKDIENVEEKDVDIKEYNIKDIERVKEKDVDVKESDNKGIEDVKEKYVDLKEPGIKDTEFEPKKEQPLEFELKKTDTLVSDIKDEITEDTKIFDAEVTREAEKEIKSEVLDLPNIISLEKEDKPITSDITDMKSTVTSIESKATDIPKSEILENVTEQKQEQTIPDMKDTKSQAVDTSETHVLEVVQNEKEELSPEKKAEEQSTEEAPIGTEKPSVEETEAISTVAEEIQEISAPEFVHVEGKVPLDTKKEIVIPDTVVVRDSNTPTTPPTVKPETKPPDIKSPDLEECCGCVCLPGRCPKGLIFTEDSKPEEHKQNKTEEPARQLSARVSFAKQLIKQPKDEVKPAKSFEIRKETTTDDAISPEAIHEIKEVEKELNSTDVGAASTTEDKMEPSISTEPKQEPLIPEDTVHIIQDKTLVSIGETVTAKESSVIVSAEVPTKDEIQFVTTATITQQTTDAKVATVTDAQIATVTDVQIATVTATESPPLGDYVLMAEEIKTTPIVAEATVPTITAEPTLPTIIGEPTVAIVEPIAPMIEGGIKEPAETEVKSKAREVQVQSTSDDKIATPMEIKTAEAIHTTPESCCGCSCVPGKCPATFVFAQQNQIVSPEGRIDPGRPPSRSTATNVREGHSVAASTLKITSAVNAQEPQLAALNAGDTRTAETNVREGQSISASVDMQPMQRVKSISTDVPYISGSKFQSIGDTHVPYQPVGQEPYLGAAQPEVQPTFEGDPRSVLSVRDSHSVSTNVREGQSVATNTNLSLQVSTHSAAVLTKGAESTTAQKRPSTLKSIAPVLQTRKGTMPSGILDDGDVLNKFKQHPPCPCPPDTWDIDALKQKLIAEGYTSPEFATSPNVTGFQPLYPSQGHTLTEDRQTHPHQSFQENPAAIPYISPSVQPVVVSSDQKSRPTSDITDYKPVSEMQETVSTPLNFQRRPSGTARSDIQQMPMGVQPIYQSTTGTNVREGISASANTEVIPAAGDVDFRQISKDYQTPHQVPYSYQTQPHQSSGAQKLCKSPGPCQKDAPYCVCRSVYGTNNADDLPPKLPVKPTMGASESSPIPVPSSKYLESEKELASFSIKDSAATNTQLVDTRQDTIRSLAPTRASAPKVYKYPAPPPSSALPIRDFQPLVVPKEVSALQYEATSYKEVAPPPSSLVTIRDYQSMPTSYKNLDDPKHVISEVPTLQSEVATYKDVPQSISIPPRTSAVGDPQSKSTSYKSLENPKESASKSTSYKILEKPRESESKSTTYKSLEKPKESDKSVKAPFVPTRPSAVLEKPRESESKSTTYKSLEKPKESDKSVKAPFVPTRPSAVSFKDVVPSTKPTVPLRESVSISTKFLAVEDDPKAVNIDLIAEFDALHSAASGYTDMTEDESLMPEIHALRSAASRLSKSIEDLKQVSQGTETDVRLPITAASKDLIPMTQRRSSGVPVGDYQSKRASIPKGGATVSAVPTPGDFQSKEVPKGAEVLPLRASSVSFKDVIATSTTAIPLRETVSISTSFKTKEGEAKEVNLDLMAEFDDLLEKQLIAEDESIMPELHALRSAASRLSKSIDDFKQVSKSTETDKVRFSISGGSKTDLPPKQDYVKLSVKVEESIPEGYDELKAPITGKELVPIYKGSKEGVLKPKKPGVTTSTTIIDVEIEEEQGVVVSKQSVYTGMEEVEPENVPCAASTADVKKPLPCPVKASCTMSSRYCSLVPSTVRATGGTSGTISIHRVLKSKPTDLPAACVGSFRIDHKCGVKNSCLITFKNKQFPLRSDTEDCIMPMMEDCNPSTVVIHRAPIPKIESPVRPVEIVKPSTHLCARNVESIKRICARKQGRLTSLPNPRSCGPASVPSRSPKNDTENQELSNNLPRLSYGPSGIARVQADKKDDKT